MEVLAYKLIEQLLEELSKDNAIAVSIQGPIKDSATVAFPTFLGGVCLGPAGAVLGACVGTGLLGISKALGFGNYRPLMTVLREDLHQREREELYERLWEKLQSFVTSPLNQSFAYSVITQLSAAVQSDSDAMQNIRNEISATLRKRNMTLQ